MSQPNILFLMTDQQRWDAMGCSGEWVNTPSLDRIASEGVRFSNCITTTPICIPARVTLQTGLYPHNTHVWNNINFTLPTTAQSWMREIRELGYRTSLFGKTHLHPHRGDLRKREHLLHGYGLDDVNEIGGPRASAVVMSHMTQLWEDKGLLERYREDFRDRFATKPHVVRPSTNPLEYYTDVYVGQMAKEYLQSYKHENPWFCWVSFGGPHEPWDSPEPYASMYDVDSMPTPTKRFENVRGRPEGWLDYFMEQRSPRFDEGDQAAMRANYAGNVTLIDDQIGEILSVIEGRGEMDNTVIAFTSDHGEMNGDADLIYKMNFLDGSLRVPLIVRTPETARNFVDGLVNESMAENCDLGPTLVELAGGKIEYRQFAMSLIEAMRGPEIAHRTSALSEFRGEFMLATNEWKAAVNREGETYLLFDRTNDPFESRNLAGDPEYRQVSDSMRCQILERVSASQLKSPW